MQTIPCFIYFHFSQNNFFNAIINVCCALPYAMASSISCLFFVLVSISIIFFRQLQNTMQQGWKVVPSETEMEHWKQNYVLICQLVTEINLCFGIVLLFTICYGFINFINYSFNLSYPAEITVQWISMYGAYFFNQAFQLFLLMYVGSRLETEVLLRNI